MRRMIQVLMHWLEGALISDDPYSTIEQLDTMVEEVLHIGTIH